METVAQEISPSMVNLKDRSTIKLRSLRYQYLMDYLSDDDISEDVDINETKLQNRINAKDIENDLNSIINNKIFLQSTDSNMTNASDALSASFLEFISSNTDVGDNDDYNLQNDSLNSTDLFSNKKKLTDALDEISCIDDDQSRLSDILKNCVSFKQIKNLLEWNDCNLENKLSNFISANILNQRNIDKTDKIVIDKHVEKSHIEKRNINLSTEDSSTNISENNEKQTTNEIQIIDHNENEETCAFVDYKNNYSNNGSRHAKEALPRILTISINNETIDLAEQNKNLNSVTCVAKDDITNSDIREESDKLINLKTAMLPPSKPPIKKQDKGNKPYKCTMCNYRTSTQNLLKVHKVCHTIDKSLKCKSCAFTSNNVVTLQTHIESVHDNFRPYKCILCNVSFIRLNLFEIHLLQKHRTVMNICPFCKNIFSDRILLRNHILDNHPSGQVKATKRYNALINLADPVPVKIAPKSDETSKSCLKITDVHNNIDTSNETLNAHNDDSNLSTTINIDELIKTPNNDMDVMDEELLDQLEEPFKYIETSNICNENNDLVTDEDLLNHFLIFNSHKINKTIHNSNEVYKCGKCPFKTKFLRLLKIHSKKHNSEYKCKICDYNAISPNNLEQHIQKEHSDKPFKCQHCDFTSNDIGNISIHSRIHFGEKPFKCSRCNYHANTIEDVQTHNKKWHNDLNLAVTFVRPKPSINRTNSKFTCDICNFTTWKAQYLKIHVKNHEKDTEIIYKCEICYFSTSKEKELEEHSKQHSKSKPYKCHKCKSTFTKLRSLQYHIESIHDTDQPYHCKQCKMSFSRMYYFKRHMKLVHKLYIKQCSTCNFISYNDDKFNEHEEICQKGLFQCYSCELVCNSNDEFKQHRLICQLDQSKSRSEDVHDVYNDTLQTGKKCIISNESNINEDANNIENNLNKDLKNSKVSIETKQMNALLENKSHSSHNLKTNISKTNNKRRINNKQELNLAKKKKTGDMPIIVKFRTQSTDNKKNATITKIKPLRQEMISTIIGNNPDKQKLNNNNTSYIVIPKKDYIKIAKLNKHRKLNEIKANNVSKCLINVQPNSNEFK